MADLLKAFDENSSEIKEQILSHERKYALNEHCFELLMVISDSGKVNYESKPGIPSKEVIGDNSISLSYSGGPKKEYWMYIPAFEVLFEPEELEVIKEELAESEGLDLRKIGTNELREYYEKNHPEMIEEWLDEYIDMSYLDDGLDQYMESLRERIEDQIEDLKYE